MNPVPRVQHQGNIKWTLIISAKVKDRSLIMRWFWNCNSLEYSDRGQCLNHNPFYWGSYGQSPLPICQAKGYRPFQISNPLLLTVCGRGGEGMRLLWQGPSWPTHVQQNVWKTPCSYKQHAYMACILHQECSTKLVSWSRGQGYEYTIWMYLYWNPPWVLQGRKGSEYFFKIKRM